MDYDKVFKEDEKYRGHYRDSPLFPLWQRILKYVRGEEDPRILEIGCGTGQLAHFLYDEGFKHYRGFDPSKEGVKIAAERVKQYFTVGDALDKQNYDWDYNLVISTEVFEHIENDKAVIHNIRDGTKILFSVATFPYEGHVRWFRNPGAIQEYYFDCIRIIHVGWLKRRQSWALSWGEVRHGKNNNAGRSN